MNLKSQLEEKLLSVKQKFLKSQEAYKHTYLYITKTLRDELLDDSNRRHFALKKSEVEKIYETLKTFLNYYNTFVKYKDLIANNESAYKTSLDFLERLEDNFSDIIAELQSILISLEYCLKEK